MSAATSASKRSVARSRCSAHHRSSAARSAPSSIDFRRTPSFSHAFFTQSRHAFFTASSASALPAQRLTQ